MVFRRLTCSNDHTNAHLYDDATTPELQHETKWQSESLHCLGPCSRLFHRKTYHQQSLLVSSYLSLSGWKQKDLIGYCTLFLIQFLTSRFIFKWSVLEFSKSFHLSYSFCFYIYFIFTLNFMVCFYLDNYLLCNSNTKTTTTTTIIVITQILKHLVKKEKKKKAIADNSWAFDTHDHYSCVI